MSPSKCSWTLRIPKIRTSLLFYANQIDLVREENFVSISFVTVSIKIWTPKVISNQLPFVIREWSVYNYSWKRELRQQGEEGTTPGTGEG